jgi:hypothetical protein
MGFGTYVKIETGNRDTVTNEPITRYVNIKYLDGASISELNTKGAVKTDFVAKGCWFLNYEKKENNFKKIENKLENLYKQINFDNSAKIDTKKYRQKLNKIKDEFHKLNSNKDGFNQGIPESFERQFETLEKTLSNYEKDNITQI